MTGRPGERAEAGTIGLALPSGLRAEVMAWGATLHALHAPDAQGRHADILAGPATPAAHRAARGFFGVIVGRYANRIARGRFTLDGRSYAIPANDGPHALHGGPEGFDRRLWEVEETGPAHVRLRLDSPDGDQGFPGRLIARVTYALEPPARLSITMEAEVDRPCPVNLTNHAFFNLGGAGRTAMDHHLSVAASRVLLGDADGIPEAPVPVEGTPFDLRRARPLEPIVRADHPQILGRKGIDHNYCLDDADGTLRPVARLSDPASGRALTLSTDRPGLQVYTGNFLDGTRVGKQGFALRQGDAICLEPQDWPDAPNRPDFPPALARPGEAWRHRMALDLAAD